MGWAAHYIAALKSGQTVQFRPRGASMVGRIASGQLVTVEPIGEVLPVKDEIVLCKVNGKRFQIGNNRGGINGWTTLVQVFGRCVKVEP